jgi:hypothetical protein
VLNGFKVLQHEDASTTGVSSVWQFVFSGAKTPKHQGYAALKESGKVGRHDRTAVFPAYSAASVSPSDKASAT